MATECSTTGTPNDSWLWQGVARTPIPHLGQGEVDKVIASYPTPAGLQILTTIPLNACNVSGAVQADIVAVIHPSGGRVFNASTYSWNCMLNGACPYGWVPSSTAQTQIGQATMNAFSWIGAAESSSQVGHLVRIQASGDRRAQAHIGHARAGTARGRVSRRSRSAGSAGSRRDTAPLSACRRSPLA